MNFYKVEYSIPANVEDILAWLARDMQQGIEPYDHGKVRVTFNFKRKENVIEVFHTVKTDESSPSSGKSFSLEAVRVTDTASVIVGLYQSDNLHIKKLFYLYLARLGRAFNADFAEPITMLFQEIKEQAENYLTFPELEALEDRARSGDENALRVLDTVAREEGFESWDSLNKKLWKEYAPELEKMREAVRKEVNRRESTPGVLQVWEYLERMSQSENPLHQAIADNIAYLDIYKMGKSFQEKTLRAPLFETGQVGAIIPLIEDPTDQRIWDLIKADPSITDSQIAAHIDITRQAVNQRRRSLEKMGYQVRVSRQK
ncbi:MAG TPA: winged helix-turn-helix domain-containing protein [Anaerolineales bacterium]|nr:winged helix-turn-helix domain-containing protein [Anaerolineales bacterium]MCC7511554.1 winged helix-turn-helix domain-containing protein [Anaerolineae bacterium]MCG3145282.1 hypothetical protein [Gammaproteobacteria bacterium]GIK10730.1 MAG: hypothetical protein BroJett001_27960 [Chloroflexota bacterium]MCZ2288506.1 winged helix-turn-helix domain-containing protein [Anaerolineales bacterium]